MQGRLKNPGNEDLWLAAVRTELRAEKKKDAEVLLAKALQVDPSFYLGHTIFLGLMHLEMQAQCMSCDHVSLAFKLQGMSPKNIPVNENDLLLECK